MSTQPDNKVLALREAEIARLRELPIFPNQRPDEEKGVLLSDRIDYYCREFHLIWPYDDELLRPAGYDLTVGQNYSILGHPKALTDGMKLEIGPYQVAIIETYETINMPEFLIGRWNVRVKHAYKGLLWVGEAQVDPGFRGHLCCPIYNLSTEPMSLEFREPLAMIDFVTTTPYQEGKCKPFRWWNRTMIVFPEYRALSSGIEAEVDEFKKTIKRDKEEVRREVAEAAAKWEEGVQSLKGRTDTFVTLTLTVMAVLFAGLGIVATKGSAETSFWTPTVWVAVAAFYLALRPRVGDRGRRILEWGIGILAAVIVVAVMALHFSNARIPAKELEQAREQASEAASAVTQQKRHFEEEIRELRQQSDAKVDSLQRQINLLQQSQVNRR